MFQNGQPVDVVLGCKSGDEFLLVLVHPWFKIVGDADVKISRSAREDVNVILLHRLLNYVSQSKPENAKADSSSHGSSE